MSFRGNYREADRPHDAPRDEAEIFPTPKKAPRFSFEIERERAEMLQRIRVRGELIARRDKVFSKLTRNRERDRFDYADEIMRPEDVVREYSSLRNHPTADPAVTHYTWRPGYVPRKEDP